MLYLQYLHRADRYGRVGPKQWRSRPLLIVSCGSLIRIFGRLEFSLIQPDKESRQTLESRLPTCTRSSVQSLGRVGSEAWWGVFVLRIVGPALDCHPGLS